MQIAHIVPAGFNYFNDIKDNVFKIVEEYVDVCIHPPKGGLKREEYIEHLKKIYKAGQYKKVVEALEQVLIAPPKKEEK